MDYAALKTEEVVQCILCDSTEYVSDERFRRLLALDDPFDVQRCCNCSLAWLSPRPTADAYEKLYSYESYFEGEAVVESYTEVANIRRHHFRKRIERIKAQFTNSSEIRLLDIGAATGEFVYESRQAGLVADGIEISEGAREQARKSYGIDLHPGPLEDVAATHNYDVIHMNHVLEHMSDPSRVLSDCMGILNSGGILVIEVPQQFDNDIDRIKYTLGLKKPQFNTYSLHHLYFFLPETASSLIRKAGFRLLSVATANPHRTPLIPFSLKYALLRPYLWMSDKTHRGGNIIEIYSQKP